MLYSLRFVFLFGVVATLSLSEIKRMKTVPTTEATTTTPTTTTTEATTTTTTPTTTTTTPTTTTTTPTTTTTEATTTETTTETSTTETTTTTVLTTTTAIKYITFTLTYPGRQLTDCTAGCATGWKYMNYKCYKKFTKALTYSAAQSACVAQGAQLTSISTSAENEALRREFDTNALVEESAESWIGLKKSGSSWKWDDGTSMSFSNWAPNQPASALCVQMITDALSNSTYKYQRGYWKTYDCSQTSASYICEKAASI